MIGKEKKMGELLRENIKHIKVQLPPKKKMRAFLKD